MLPQMRSDICWKDRKKKWKQWEKVELGKVDFLQKNAEMGKYVKSLIIPGVSNTCFAGRIWSVWFLVGYVDKTAALYNFLWSLYGPRGQLSSQSGPWRDLSLRSLLYATAKSSIQTKPLKTLETQIWLVIVSKYVLLQCVHVSVARV